MNFATIVVVFLIGAVAAASYQVGRKHGEILSRNPRAKLTQRQIMELERYDTAMHYKLVQWDLARQDPKPHRPERERMGQEP